MQILNCENVNKWKRKAQFGKRSMTPGRRLARGRQGQPAWQLRAISIFYEKLYRKNRSVLVSSESSNILVNMNGYDKSMNEYVLNMEIRNQ